MLAVAVFEAFAGEAEARASFRHPPTVPFMGVWTMPQGATVYVFSDQSVEELEEMGMTEVDGG